MAEQQEARPVILSGMQPTGTLMIGNYAGAARNWVQLQNTYDSLFCIVDMHAITIRPEPARLRHNTLDVTALYLACGIDPERSTVFIQSHVPEHAQLAWVLNCIATMGECSKMTQFKEKSAKHTENVGLFTYPVLMAADILLYQANLVPVGNDQKQHLELARNIAERFNHYYSPTFTVPEPYIPPSGFRIMSLQDPGKKMSKSDENEKATIFLTDPPEQIRNKIKRAVTDSGTDISYDERRPALRNLIDLYSVATDESAEEIVARFSGQGYAEFKAALADAVVEKLRPIQQRYQEIRNDKGYLESILRKGAGQARARAQKTLRKVYKKVGFVPAIMD